VSTSSEEDADVCDIREMRTSPICRVCFEGAEDGLLIAPCLCTGSVQYVHSKCLERWRRDAGGLNALRCEICHAEYTIKREKTRRLRACGVILGCVTVALAVAAGLSYLLQSWLFSCPEMVRMYHLHHLDREAHMGGRMLVGFIALLWIIGLPMGMVVVVAFVPCVGAFVFLSIPLLFVAAFFSEEARQDLLKIVGDRKVLVLNAGLGCAMIISTCMYGSFYQCAQSVGSGTVVAYRARSAGCRVVRRVLVWLRGQGAQIRPR
jgi:hypothetical protein